MAREKIFEQSKQIQQDASTIQIQSRNIQAEHEAGQKQLARSFVNEARALRMSGRPGQRFGALRAIRESLKITGPTRELADEAAAALCLPDWGSGIRMGRLPAGYESPGAFTDVRSVRASRRQQRRFHSIASG
jgi:hypothetical protein